MNTQFKDYTQQRYEIDQKKFDFIKKKYAYCSSWAVWVDKWDKPKDNMGDLTILDTNKNQDLLKQLKPNIILCGLNISRGDIKYPLANFHDKRPEAMDFKIRYALKDSPYWGAYMTDIIKDFEQKVSGKVTSYLRENRDFEKENVEKFKEEIYDLGVKNPLIIAFGDVTYNILYRNFKNIYKIIKIPHYSHFISKENYRLKVKSILKF